MKALLVAEYRDGQLLGSYQELIGFASQLGADYSMFMVGSSDAHTALSAMEEENGAGRELKMPPGKVASQSTLVRAL